MSAIFVKFDYQVQFG